ncbi:MAG TPA: sigma 54-interacting transcriptional regulator [Burkholderiales bacterium]|nr:sigma 54-interacting transcriptional regulator [Burkholderiales bacterium]
MMKQPNIDYRQVLDRTPALIFSARPDGYIDYVNQRWLDLVGVGLEAAQGSKWTSFVHPDDLPSHLQRWRQAMATGEPATSLARFRIAGGEYRWMLHHTEPLRDSSGNIVRWFGSSVDIEQLKRVEHELHDLKERLHKENLALREEISQTSMFEEIVGSSAALRRVLTLVGKVAGTDSTVLITGETGTGKELIARAIHKRSPRASRPFVCVSCAAIPAALISSELFGHEKGAFTGAVQRHLGRFELAEGGTILLDEVGELPQETQITLLRVLQERTFERVGGCKAIPADVRVIAATNRDLSRAIASGSFRSDLYYRLSVFPVHLPPLRERVEDIPLLVQYLAQRYAAKAGKKIAGVSRATIDRLVAYDWPGNIRELQNIIQRAVILGEGTLAIDEAWLPGRRAPPTGAAPALARPCAGEETALIEEALAACHGRVAGPGGAAARLGLPRSTLESRIRSLDIDKHRFKSMRA